MVILMKDYQEMVSVLSAEDFKKKEGMIEKNRAS